MNLPSLTRAAFATGILSTLLILSAGAVTPPDLKIQGTSLLTFMRSGASAQLSGHVYYVGGFLGPGATHVTGEGADIDVLTAVETSLANLPTPRAGLGLTGFLWTPSTGARNALIAVGGVDNSGTVLNTVELYDTNSKSWITLPSMPTPRAYLTVVAGTDNMIYAIGGVNSSGQPVGTVEAYSPTSNSWSTVASLNTPRGHLAGTIVTLDNIFIAGGIDASHHVLNTTEVYNLANKSWIPFFPMNKPRADFGLAVAGDGFLHAFGGISAKGQTKSIEGYNFNTGKWTIEPETLGTANAFLSAVEGLDGNVYLMGGNLAVANQFAKAAVPPAAPSHSVKFFLHTLEEAEINGNFAMDDQVPLFGNLLQLGLLSSTNFATFPAVTGTIAGSADAVTVFVPTTLLLGLINGATLYATDLDGGNQVTLGSTSSLIGLGLGGSFTVPISSSGVTLNKKVLVLNLSTILGLDLNLGGGAIYMQINGLTGVPSNSVITP